MTLAVRTVGDPLKLANAVRAQVQAIDKDQPVADIQTMEEIVGRSVVDRRFSILLLTAFAGLAVLLAAIGTYGVIAYAVAQRTHEIGVRIAVGARSGHILALVAREGASLAGMEVVVGAGAAVALTRTAEEPALRGWRDRSIGFLRCSAPAARGGACRCFDSGTARAFGRSGPRSASRMNPDLYLYELTHYRFFARADRHHDVKARRK
jgi:hypothetical protein